jgi:hypothetical protein
MSHIKLVENGGSLSESDLQLIAGSDLVFQMMRNRLVIVTDNSDVDWSSLTDNLMGLYHIRTLDRSKQIYQVWFELENDINKFKKNLMVGKLSKTAHTEHK